MGKQALAALGLCLLLAACGSTGQKPVRSSRASFLADANRICAQATTRTGRVARLRGLHPPLGAADLYAHWLRAEQDALAAAASLDERSKTTELDPRVALAIAEGKIAGYARRLGTQECAKPQTGTIRP